MVKSKLPEFFWEAFVLYENIVEDKKDQTADVPAVW